MDFIFAAKTRDFSLEGGTRCDSVRAAWAGEPGPAVGEFCASRTCIVGIGRRPGFGSSVVISFLLGAMVRFLWSVRVPKKNLSKKLWLAHKKWVALPNPEQDPR